MTSTTGIIHQRINTVDIPDPATLEGIWASISPMDDGLPDRLPLQLSASQLWEGPQRP